MCRLEKEGGIDDGQWSEKIWRLSLKRSSSSGGSVPPPPPCVRARSVHRLTWMCRACTAEGSPTPFTLGPLFRSAKAEQSTQSTTSVRQLDQAEYSQYHFGPVVPQRQSRADSDTGVRDRDCRPQPRHDVRLWAHDDARCAPPAALRRALQSRRRAGRRRCRGRGSARRPDGALTPACPP